MKCANLDYLCLLPEDYRTQQGGKVLVRNEENNQLVNMTRSLLDLRGLICLQKMRLKIGKAFAELKLSGLKLHSGKWYFYPTDERMMPLYDIREKYEKPIIFHSGMS